MQRPFWTKTWLMIAIALVALAVAATPVLAVDVPPDTKNAAPAEPAGDNQVQAPTLLENWFGVNLSIYNYNNTGRYAFDQSSFAPTKRGLTVNWVEDDWFGTGTTIGSTVWGQYPSSGELYDVEAIYFDNDMNNIYITIVTSFPFDGLQYDYNTWVAPGDLSLNLGINDPRSSADPWRYDFGVNLVQETRPATATDIPAPPVPHVLGDLLYKTANTEWYPGTYSVDVTAGSEHTNFSPATGNTARGAVTVAYEPVVFANNENQQGTYAIAVTIPRSYLSYDGHPDGPKHGETIGIRWTPSCRNDGNETDPVILLVGTIEDIDTGDAPDSSNHPAVGMTYDGLSGSVGGFFPTVADPLVAGAGKTGMCHYIKPEGAFLGASVSEEADADLQPDPDTNPAPFNLLPVANINDGDSDNGLVLPDWWFNQVQTIFTYTVTLPAGATAEDRYVNVWFDWNRDGDWADAAVVCNTAGATAAEHVLPNQVVNVAPGSSQTFVSNVIPCNNPDFFNDKTAVWVRITLSDEAIVLGTQFDGSGRAAGTTYEYCYAEGETEDWYFSPKDPSAVELARFEALAAETGILLEWETATEIDNLGFNLYRSTALNGDYVQLNEALIPAQNPGAVFGGVYTWVDETVTPGVTYFYKLEDVDIYGVATLHGPVQATALAAGPTSVSVTAFSAGGGMAWALPAALSALALLGFKRRRK